MTGENPFFGTTHNPWNLDRIAGGSSSGSAAAVASMFCLAASGSDTGGSVREPACFCGVVGFKPTFGSIDTYGIIPLSPSLDHPGIITLDAYDALLLLRIIASENVRKSYEYRRLPNKRIKIGYFAELPMECENRVRTAFEDSLRDLKESGRVTLEEVRYPETNLIDATVFDIFEFESKETMEEDQLLHAPEKQIFRNGRLRSADKRTSRSPLQKSLQLRKRLTAEVSKLFRKVDVLAMPTTPVVAPRIESDHVRINGKSYPLFPTLSKYLYLFNLTGNPSISVPNGFTRFSLPCGLQLIGRHGEDYFLLQFASELQNSGHYRPRRPAL